MRFENLTDIHSGRNTKRVQDDVNRGAISHEGHVFDRKDLGNNTLVAVTTGELVAHADLALLCDIHAHELVDARRKFMTIVAAEHLDVDDLALFAVRNLERGVANFASLLTEDCTKETLFWSEFRFTLRGDLADKNIACRNFSTHTNDSALIKISENFIGKVRNITSDFFRTKFRVARIDFVFLDMDRRKYVVLYKALGENDGVFEVVALPWHECHDEVLAEGKFTIVGGRTVSENVALLHCLTLGNNRLLIDAGVLVRTFELEQAVDRPSHVLVLNSDGIAIDLSNRSVLFRHDHVGSIASST
ncbi:unannotated protein [freshwater metagenome]|uniref:Unannotated protein n=1 Tax=freshwater metagenome TaxID=449393 RepID=A0A6J6R7U2_9ZZZZ